MIGKEKRVKWHSSQRTAILCRHSGLSTHRWLEADQFLALGRRPIPRQFVDQRIGDCHNYTRVTDAPPRDLSVAWRGYG
jgi:hypothetical protein